MNNSKPSPAATHIPRQAQAANARPADSSPAVITTDFSAKPFGRCGLLPPGHRIATHTALADTASQTARRTG